MSQSSDGSWGWLNNYQNSHHIYRKPPHHWWTYWAVRTPGCGHQSTENKNQKTIYPLVSDEEEVFIEEARIIHNTHVGSCSYTFLKDWKLGGAFSHFFFKAILKGSKQDQLARRVRFTKIDAYLQRSLMNAKAYIRFYIDDILNQNRGVNARTKGTYIEREEIETLKRYYMLSFLYYFTGKK